MLDDRKRRRERKAEMHDGCRPERTCSRWGHNWGAEPDLSEHQSPFLLCPFLRTRFPSSTGEGAMGLDKGSTALGPKLPALCFHGSVLYAGCGCAGPHTELSSGSSDLEPAADHRDRLALHSKSSHVPRVDYGANDGQNPLSTPTGSP